MPAGKRIESELAGSMLRAPKPPCSCPSTSTSRPETLPGPIRDHFVKASREKALIDLPLGINPAVL